jgi:hypothetical protein
MLRRRTTRKHCRKISSLGRAFVLVILFYFLSACENPFVTRTPESPAGTGSRWIPPFSAEIVIENLRNAISDRNLENYVRCFSDSSRASRRLFFAPEITVANNNPGAFVNWSLPQERDYFSQLRAAVPVDSICSLRLDSLQTSLFGDSAQFFYAYDLTARHRRQASGVPGRVRGELRFALVKDSFGEWSIQRWLDFATGPAQTWSALKVAFVR